MAVHAGGNRGPLDLTAFSTAGRGASRSRSGEARFEGQPCLAVQGFRIVGICDLPAPRRGNVAGKIQTDPEGRIAGYEPEYFIGTYGAAAGHLAEDIVSGGLSLDQALEPGRWREGSFSKKD